MSWSSRSAGPRDRPALLEVSGLTKSFGPLTVLRQVSLQVSRGEIVAVAGGNGAGKSTLIGTIAGVLDAEAVRQRPADAVPARPGPPGRHHSVSPPLGTDVTVRAAAAPGCAGVQIIDHGAGVPAGLAEKIFEPRVRGTTEMAGTGLGLPMARGIVEAHGGTLVMAPANPGASFVVTLPADPPPGDTRERAGASWNVVEEPEEQRGG